MIHSGRRPVTLGQVAVDVSPLQQSIRYAYHEKTPLKLSSFLFPSSMLASGKHLGRQLRVLRQRLLLLSASLAQRMQQGVTRRRIRHADEVLVIDGAEFSLHNCQFPSFITE